MFLPSDFREFVTASMTMPILTPVKSTKAVRVKSCFYFGRARSEGFATLRNVSKLEFLGQDWACKVCRFLVLFSYLTK